MSEKKTKEKQINKSYSNLTTQPFSAKSLRKALEKVRKQKSDLGAPVEMKVKGMWIRPLWWSREDFHNLINTAYPKH